MTGVRVALAGAVLTGIAGLGLAGFGPEDPPAVALNDTASTAGCSSCDARHQRLAQRGLSATRGEE